MCLLIAAVVAAVSSPLPGLLSQAHRARALPSSPEPPDGTAVRGRERRGTPGALPLCGGAPVPAPGVSHVAAMQKYIYQTRVTINY